MYILIIDQGTTSSRAILFDLEGKIIRQASVVIKTKFPKISWVEQSPQEIWLSTVSCLKQVTSGIDLKKILACGITNQRETTILWDGKTGQAYGPALVWQDRRTQAWCDQFKIHNPMIAAKTGLKVDPYFSASKIKWLLDQRPQHDIQHVKFGTVDSFLLWHLSAGKVHRTDVTNASRTLLFNIYEGNWDQDLLNLFQIPDWILPKVHDSNFEFAMMDSSILGQEIPILAMIGDQQAGLIGVGCLEKNDVKVTFGTGGFLMQNLGPNYPQDNQGLLTTIAYRQNNSSVYALEGSIYDAGSAVDWLRNQLGVIVDYNDIPQKIAHLSSNQGVYFIPAFSGMGAPYWIPDSGAMFVGLSRSTEQAHLVRAVLESIAYQTYDILSLMSAHQNIQSLKVDGGMIDNVWFLQFLADLCQLPISIPNTNENTAKGAAMMTAFTLGRANHLQEISQTWNHFSEITPNQTRYEESYLGWKEVIQKFIAYHGYSEKNKLNEF